MARPFVRVFGPGGALAFLTPRRAVRKRRRAAAVLPFIKRL